MHSEQGPVLRQGFDEAETETVEAQRRRQSWNAGAAVQAGAAVDAPVSNDLTGERGPAAGDPALGDPALGDPALGDPALGDPALGDPALGDPALGDPAGAGTSGDLAHDFSNLAMSVVSAANLLQRSSNDPARVAQIARLLRETGERAVAIARRLPPRAPAD